MSEPSASSIPTSTSRPRGRPPAKRARLNPSAAATTVQARAITSLFLEPEKPIALPVPSSSSSATVASSLPPEIVPNVQGSSAGAGSGEFHVYKASRRREMERLARMEEEARGEEEGERWEREERERRERDEERVKKNREKRNKKKMRKGKNVRSMEGEEGEGEGEDRGKKDEDGVLKGSNRAKVPGRGDGVGGGIGEGDEELGIGLGAAKVVEEVAVTIHDDDED